MPFSIAMKIDIIPIAQRKIKRRGISERWIKETILNPDQQMSGHTGRTVAQKLYKRGDKEMLLRVIYEEKNNEATIISAYLTSQIKRYL